MLVVDWERSFRSARVGTAYGFESERLQGFVRLQRPDMEVMLLEALNLYWEHSRRSASWNRLVIDTTGMAP